MAPLSERVGVGVGVVVYHPQESDKVLVGRRNYKQAAGLQQLPGGSVDAGESPHDAVVREVYEEAGIQIENVRPLGLWAYERLEQDGDHFVDLFFVCDARDPENLRNMEPEKNEGWEWLPWDEIEDRTFWNFKHVLGPALGW